MFVIFPASKNVFAFFDWTLSPDYTGVFLSKKLNALLVKNVKMKPRWKCYGLIIVGRYIFVVFFFEVLIDSCSSFFSDRLQKNMCINYFPFQNVITKWNSDITE